MIRVAFTAAVVAASLAFASVASAASVTIGVASFGVGSGNLASARAAQATFHGAGATIVEDFEDFTMNGPKSFTAPTITSSVGIFTSIAPFSLAGSSLLSPNDQLHVRNGSGNTSSRINTTLGGKNYLDSNDSSGILLTMPGGAGVGAFDRLSFLATDIDDVGQDKFNFAFSGDVTKTFDLLADSGLSIDRKTDGELLLFTFLFDKAVKDVSLAMNIDRGDGFSIDDVTVSQVPLPAAAWMLLAGVGALVGVGRARRRA